MSADETLSILRTSVEALEDGLVAKWGAGEMDPFGDDDEAREVVKAFKELDECLSQGGLLPADWASAATQ